MSRRLKTFVWLLCAVLLPAQSLLPASAARVAMRCAGMPASAPMCAEAIVPVAESASAQSHAMPMMACCRHMAQPCPTMGGMSRRAHSRPQAALSAPSCLVSVSPLTTERPATLADAHAGLLLADLPAPSAPLSIAAPCPAATPLRAASALPCAGSPPAHGLRAPPAV